jgi:hypothetical protein
VQQQVCNRGGRRLPAVRVHAQQQQRVQRTNANLAGPVAGAAQPSTQLDPSKQEAPTPAPARRGRPAGRQAKIHQLPRASRPQSCHSPDDLFTAMRLRASVRLAVSVLFSSDDTASRLGDGE